eukprot:9581216-Alexandrium_andersonii.AAC.1
MFDSVGPFQADLNQWPRYAHRGPKLGSLLRQTGLWSWTRNRPWGSRALMVAQGSPVVDHGPRLGRAKSFSPNANVLASLTYKQRVQLNGNGQHMSSIGAFVMFCFAHLMLRNDS